MKLTDLKIDENVNTHLTHLEDLSLFKGKKGAVEAIRFLKNLSTDRFLDLLKNFKLDFIFISQIKPNN